MALLRRPPVAACAPAASPGGSAEEGWPPHRHQRLTCRRRRRRRWRRWERGRQAATGAAAGGVGFRVAARAAGDDAIASFCICCSSALPFADYAAGTTPTASFVVPIQEISPQGWTCFNSLNLKGVNICRAQVTCGCCILVRSRAADDSQSGVFRIINAECTFCLCGLQQREFQGTELRGVGSRVGSYSWRSSWQGAPLSRQARQ